MVFAAYRIGHWLRLSRARQVEGVVDEFKLCRSYGVDIVAPAEHPFGIREVHGLGGLDDNLARVYEGMRDVSVAEGQHGIPFAFCRKGRHACRVNIYRPFYAQPLLLDGLVRGYVALSGEALEPLFVRIPVVGHDVEHGPDAPGVGPYGYHLHGGPVQFCWPCGYCCFCCRSSPGGVYVDEVLFVKLGIALQQKLIRLWAPPVYWDDGVSDAPIRSCGGPEHTAIGGLLQLCGKLWIFLFHGDVADHDSLESL